MLQFYLLMPNPCWNRWVCCVLVCLCVSLSLFRCLLWMGRMSSLSLTWSSSSSLLEILCNLRKIMGFHYYSYKSCCHSSLQLSNLVYIPPISLSLSLSVPCNSCKATTNYSEPTLTGRINEYISVSHFQLNCFPLASVSLCFCFQADV